jgi:hypothetical protein
MQWYVFIFLGCAAYLYLNLFVTPRVPYLLGSDQTFFWTYGERFFHGQVIYRDFYQYTAPGTDVVFAAGFWLFGMRLWVLSTIILCLGVFLACLCFSLARQFLTSAQAAMATALFTVVIYGKELNATHHWFSVLFLLLAVRVAMPRISARRIAISAVFLSLATLFNQVHGVVALLAFIVFLLLRGLREKLEPAETLCLITVLVLSYTAALLCFGAYFIKTAGLERIWYCVATSAARYSASYRSGRALRAMMTVKLLRYPAMYLLFFAVYAATAWKCWRARHESSFRWNEVSLLCASGFMLLLEVTICINGLRIAFVSMPAVILAVLLVKERFPLCKWLPVASILLAIVAAHQIVEKHRIFRARVTLPAGKAAVAPESVELLQWVTAHTHPGDDFLSASWPGLYVPLQLNNPLYMPTISPYDGFTARDIEPSIQQIQASQVQYVLWNHALAKQCYYIVCDGDDLSPIQDYLSSSYRIVHAFSNGDVIWQKKENAQP